MQIQVSHFSIAYSDPGSGTPVALIHSYSLNHCIWQPQVYNQALSHFF